VILGGAIRFPDVRLSLNGAGDADIVPPSFVESMDNRPKQVLVFCLSGLGDAILASPALAAVSAERHRFQLTLITMFPSTTDYLRVQGFTNDVRLIPFLGMSKLGIFRHAQALRREGFDISIIPYAMNRLGYNILSFIIGARRRIGFRYQRQSIINFPQLNHVVIDEDPKLHAVEENLRWAVLLLGSNPSRPADALRYIVPAEASQKAVSFRKPDGNLLIGIHAGCNVLKNQQSRLWPAVRFAELMERLPKARFLLFQGPQDVEINRVILAGLRTARDRVVVVEGQPMPVTAALIQRCHLFLSNDSGLMHTAAACQVPCVALFGPTNPTWVRPWKTPATIVSRRLPCSPCFYYSSQSLRCVAGLDFACVREITVDEVCAAVQNLLVETNAKTASAKN